jgi:hypothetical protein
MTTTCQHVCLIQPVDIGFLPGTRRRTFKKQVASRAHSDGWPGLWLVPPGPPLPLQPAPVFELACLGSGLLSVELGWTPHDVMHLGPGARHTMPHTCACGPVVCGAALRAALALFLSFSRSLVLSFSRGSGPHAGLCYTGIGIMPYSALFLLLPPLLFALYPFFLQ